MFGVHSKLRFMSTAQDHEQKCTTFGNTNGQMVQMPCLQEKSDGCSAFFLSITGHFYSNRLVVCEI